MTLSSDLFYSRLAVIGVLAVTLGLAGCGRKGPLELPPAAVNAENSAQVGEDGKPLASQGQNKRIPLDRLLD